MKFIGLHGRIGTPRAPDPRHAPPPPPFPLCTMLLQEQTWDEYRI